MALPKVFEKDLNATLDKLDGAVEDLKGLYGRAHLDKLPQEIERMLERKAIAAGHLADQLRDIPHIQARVEDEEHKAKLHATHAPAAKPKPQPAGRKT